ncbi:hypothetical protein C8F04DRAFT_1179280 [Mycena alexandri]|uniref:Uncharacterized protein n=1 Tax=Mycena alexandri TaxID=1745969 RepID=A0AAD6X852_9AGAR|nr:hypothetical protein C8F04DRAFT_1179280 [Mycena alexandri]
MAIPRLFLENYSHKKQVLSPGPWWGVPLCATPYGWERAAARRGAGQEWNDDYLRQLILTLANTRPTLTTTLEPASSDSLFHAVSPLTSRLTDVILAGSSQHHRNPAQQTSYKAKAAGDTHSKPPANLSRATVVGTFGFRFDDSIANYNLLGLVGDGFIGTHRCGREAEDPMRGRSAGPGGAGLHKLLTADASRGCTTKHRSLNTMGEVPGLESVPLVKKSRETSKSGQNSPKIRDLTPSLASIQLGRCHSSSYPRSRALRTRWVTLRVVDWPPS